MSKILFDTNILIYNQNQDSPLYPQANKYHQLAQKQKIKAFITPQNLTEFTAVITNPKRIAKPLSQKTTTKEIKKYLDSPSFTLICPYQQTLIIFTKLLNKYKAKKPSQIFDMFLVATMLSNKIKNILTANHKDFIHIKEIQTIKLTSTTY